MNNKSLIVELAEVIARHWPGRGHVLRRLARALVPHPGTFIVTLLTVGAVLFAQQAGALPFRAPMLAGDSTTTISYQGRLADSNGNPVTTSGVGMQFRLYNTDTGGSSLWEEPHTAVPVEDGLFHVLLGSTAPIPVSLLANNSTLWLGITVGADSEMRPLEQIASVPYAMIASTVPDGAVTTEKIADEAVTQAKLGSDVSLEPPDGSITTEKLADGAVTSAKLDPSVKMAPTTTRVSSAAQSNLVATSTWTYLSPLSISLSAEDVPVSSKLLVQAWVVHRRVAPGSQTNEFRVYVDDVAVGEIAYDYTDNNGYRTVNLTELVDVTEGAHTVKVYYRNPGGAMYVQSRVLLVTVFSQ